MRLRNLFLLLLLCMTVGVFSVACTGDDGAQGPPGPQGEQGPPGDAAGGGGGGGGDVPEVLETYSFLKSWGVDEGVSCSSDILSTTADLPGPDLSAINREESGFTQSDVTATCGGTFDTAVTQGLTSPGTATAGPYFYKTHTLEESIKEGPTPSPATPSSLYSETTVTKDIVGGKVYAKLAATGGDEAIERQLLHSQCSEGTDPPDILGDFRAVKIVSDTKEYENGRVCTDDDETCAPTSATKTTTKYKVCVRLDAHPGQVKCLVVDHGVDVATLADNKTIVGLYDGMDVNDLKVPGVDPGDDNGTANNTDNVVDLGSITSTGTFFDETNGGQVYEHLCQLFGLE